MSPDDRLKLQRVLASFDEAGLVALSNKGLVRRAAKDLEAGGLSHEETERGVLVRGPGWTVTMPPEGPTRATDDTRATGVTRQILTATIYLRDHWAGGAATAADESATETAAPQAKLTETAETAERALLKLTVEDLQKWGGKGILREALTLTGETPEIEIERHAGLTVRFVRHEIEARLLPTGRERSAAHWLDAVLTTAPKVTHKRWVVATVLALHRREGRRIELPDATAPAEDPGAPRTRQQVLTSARSLLELMVTTGLAHPSESLIERLVTLSVSATGVHLPRLSRLLRAAADDVALILARDARADTARLFDRLATTWALAEAIAQAGPRPPVALVGQHRTEYLPAGDLELAGVGAYPWRTASGYEGLTVLFWDRTAKRFRTWTDSRPAQGASLARLAQVYVTGTVWSAAGSPDRLSRSQFTLRQARMNPQGRLSNAQQSEAARLQPTDPASLDFGDRGFRNWSQLFGYARTTWPVGLMEKNPLDRVVALFPTDWGQRVFDELQQRFVWPVIDEQGAVLELTLPWAEVYESAIEFLEAVKPPRDRLTGVVCQLALGAQGPLVQPLSLLSDGTPQGDRVLNPAFDRARLATRNSGLLERLREKYGRDRIATTMTADDELDAEPTADGDALPPALRTRLVEIESTLLRLAESGVHRLDDLRRDRLRRLAADLQRAGVAELAKALSRLNADHGAAAALLWTHYFARLYRQAAGIALSGLSLELPEKLAAAPASG